MSLLNGDIACLLVRANREPGKKFGSSLIRTSGSPNDMQTGDSPLAKGLSELELFLDRKASLRHLI